MTFRVGMKVVCVDDTGLAAHRDGAVPVKDGVYTVRWVGQRQTDCAVGIMLHEVNPGLNHFQIEWAFRASRFRPVVTRSTETGMAVLTEILRTVGDRTRVSKPAGVA